MGQDTPPPPSLGLLGYGKQRRMCRLNAPTYEEQHTRRREDIVREIATCSTLYVDFNELDANQKVVCIMSLPSTKLAEFYVLILRSVRVYFQN